MGKKESKWGVTIFPAGFLSVSHIGTLSQHLTHDSKRICKLLISFITYQNPIHSFPHLAPPTLQVTIIFLSAKTTNRIKNSHGDASVLCV